MAMMSGIFSLLGAVVAAAGTIAAGKAQKESAYYQAQQYELKSKEEAAAGQREAMEAERNKQLVLSKQQSLAAASGLGATDPTIVELAGETAKRGTYQAQMLRYGGEERATGLRAQAVASRMSGDAALAGAQASAAGSIIGGFGSMFSNFGGGGYSSGAGSYHGYG